MVAVSVCLTVGLSMFLAGLGSISSLNSLVFPSCGALGVQKPPPGNRR